MSKTVMSKSRAGFTLLEIMVSLTVGGIALSSIYAIGSASTRFFRDQQRISAAQTSLRGAMDVLKHDFERAGYLSSPNTRAVGEACAAAAFAQGGWVGAINGYTKNITKPGKFDPGNLNPSAASFFTFDDVWLTGNFATSGEYANISVSADGITVTIPMGWQSFQRDFTEWSGTAAGTCSLAVFQATFPNGRMVRLHGMNGTFFYARVNTSTCSDATATATLTLQDAVPSNCSMNGGWIAPVNTMYYHVADSNTQEDDALKRLVVLRRQEVLPSNRTQVLNVMQGSDSVPVEDRALLDYVVKFNVSFLGMFDGAFSRVPMTDLEYAAYPERVRGVIIELGVRTSQQDSEFTSLVPTAAFKVVAGVGAARVRRLRAELLLPNIAYRNLQ